MKKISKRLLLISALLTSVPLFAQAETTPTSLKMPSSKWMVGYAGTSTFTSADSLSVMHRLEKSWVQVFAVIPSWEKDFAWNLGASYKWNISGTQEKGLHAGPLLGLGNNGSKSIIFAGAAFGAHYSVDNFLFLSVDGGPTVNYYGSGKIVNFQLRPFSPYLGASVHFFVD